MVLDAIKIIITENGPIDPGEAGITDGHDHVRIRSGPDLATQTILLDDQSSITAGFAYYHQAGGGTIFDCQLGGCGPGLTGLFTRIIPRLDPFGFRQATILEFDGEKIAEKLVHLFP